MTAVTAPRPLTQEDNRALFDCGRESLNTWFRRHAWANHVSGASRVNVIADAATGRIVGYFTLSACQIERSYMPKAHQRNQPDPLPVMLLGQLAVDRAYQGQKYGAALLQFAFKMTLRAADIVGSVGVITHPLDDAVRGFYESWGFRELPFDPRRALMVRMSELRKMFENERSTSQTD